MSEAVTLPDSMTLAEFLVWDAPDGGPWQLVDGEPRAMAPASPIHGLLQNRLGGQMDRHLIDQGGRCTAVSSPGVLLGRKTDRNYRIPDIGVTCSPLVPGELALPNPILLIEILSPSNQPETWTNVWAYTTIPSVREILILRTATVGAQILRRGPDDSWPDIPANVEGADLVLDSIGFRMKLADLYAGTWLAPA
jgi:Uma2 family endonuclease